MLFSPGDKLRIICKGAKTVEAEFDFVFEAKKWYHIVLTHSTSGALHLSTIRLYVDGEQVDGHRFKYPKVSIAILLTYKQP